MLWRVAPPPEKLTRYGLTAFSMTLNEITPGLKVSLLIYKPSDTVLLCCQSCIIGGSHLLIEFGFFEQGKLPPTDSRLRPDQKHLESGEYDAANSEKLRLEQKQRRVNISILFFLE